MIAVVMLWAQTLPLMANPVDGVVSAGSANISSNGATLTVTQQTNKAVIDWRGFDIAHGETTNFVQPNAAAMTLNRVNSNAPSFINGNLNANGNLIVVNPNGVWFGSGARVDVNSLIATTAGIGNDAFMNSTGKLEFNIAGNPDAAVINNGLITAKEAGLVGLVAPNVINNGVILAKLGRVHLASGDTATVDLYGDGLLNVAVSDKVKKQLVENNGLISAAGGTIAMTAAAGKDVVNSLVKVSGELHAPSIKQHNGKIIIAAQGSNKTAKQGASTVVVDGVLNASGRNAGERGGNIIVTGDNIALLDGTVLDASGSDGLSGTTFNKAVSALREGAAGGDISVGGDYLGKGDTPTAKNLYVSSGVLVLNDALNSGDAGRSIFWSDDTTTFLGNVYARALGGKAADAQSWNAVAGGNKGDGGFVETSGHGQLNAGGYADLTASNGARGTYFLDPTNITIYGNFAPTSISGLQIWVDASNAGSITQSSGNVTAVNSLVNGYTASVTGAGTVVTGASTQNGLNVFSLNGTAALGFSGVNLGPSLSAFGLVLSNTANWNNNGVIASARGANGFILHSSSGSKTVQYYNVNGSGTFNMIASQTYGSITNYGLYEMGLSTAESFYGKDSSLTIGAAQSRGGSAVSGNVVVGGDDCCGNRYLDGKYAEFFLFNTYISANDRVRLAQYQSAKWGVALTPPGSGATEAAQATASIQKGDAVDGYSVFTTRYLERLSQSANISLQASNNITLDLQGDTMNFSTAGRTLTLTAGNQITTASTGTITTNGGAVSMYANDNIVFANALTINTNGGAVLLNADRDASGAGAINLTGTVINSSGGNVTMGGGSGTITAGTGYAVGSGSSESGILLSGGSVNAAGANIVMNGRSAVTTSSFISGISLDSAANVNTTGTGTIALNGLGNTGTGTSNRGIRIANGGTVSAQNGTVTLNGTGGGSTTAANNYGVFLGGTGGFISTNGNGAINVTGTGGNSGGSGGVNYGVYVTTAGSYIKTLGTGNINITGTKGGQSSSYGFLTDVANAVVTAGTSGNIQITSDTVSFSGAGGGNNVSSVGSLTIAPLTAVSMGVGSSATATLNLTDTALSALNAVSYTFGSGTATGVRINTSRNFGAGNIAFTSGGLISLANTLTTTSGNITFNNALMLTAAATINAGTGAVTFASTINSANQVTSANVLVVAGGGGGGGGTGGGGGGGGVINNTSYALTTNGSVTVTVGSGGSAGSGIGFAGTSGGNSVFGTLTAVGGGGGGANNNVNGLAGGSGGGGAWNSTGGAGTAGQGNAGAAGAAAGPPNYGAGGGGGAGGAGTIGTTTTGGNGGAGVANTITGSSVTYAGGGGGGVFSGGTLGTGGSGGGGNGGSNALSGTAGTANRGGGGGGAGNNTGNGGAGGSGVVIVRYTGAVEQATITGTATSTTSGNDTIWTFTSSGTFTANSVGCTGGCNLTINAASATFGGSIGNTAALGAVSITTTNSVSLPSITASTATIQTTSATADVTIPTTKIITANGTGTPLNIIAGRNFINNAGSSALSAASGRWLVYSANPSSDTIGSLSNSFRRFSCTYGGSCPAIPASGNGLLYSTTPVLTVTPNAISSIVYGASAPNLSGYAYSATGYLGTDSGADSLTGSLTGSSSYVAGSGIGTYNINYGLGALSSALGYGFSYANNASAFTVTARPITVTADAKTKTYGASDPGLTYQITSGALYGSDALTGALTRVTGENVGSYGIAQNTLAASSNYTLSYVGDNLSITPATLTVNAVAKTKTYGAADPSLTYTYSGLTNSDTAAVFSGALSRAAGETVAGGPYAIDQNTLTAGSNYTIAYTGNNLSITRAALTVSANARTKTYGAADPSLTYTYSGLTNGDTAAVFSGVLSRAAGEAVLGGPYAISQNTLAAGDNYTISYTGNNLSITPAALTITANAKTKNYGAVDPSLTYSLTGLVNGDTASIMSGHLSRDAGENMGSYTIRQNSLAANGNYTTSYQSAQLDINSSVLVIRANDIRKRYGAPDPVLTYTVSGLGSDEAANILTGSLMREAGSMAGTYRILQHTLSSSANFFLRYEPGTFTISEQELPQTVIRVSQDPTLNMPSNDNAPVSNSQVSSSGNNSNVNNQVQTNDITPTGQVAMGGGWLMIGQDLLKQLDLSSDAAMRYGLSVGD